MYPHVRQLEIPHQLRDDLRRLEQRARQPRTAPPRSKLALLPGLTRVLRGRLDPTS